MSLILLSREIINDGYPIYLIDYLENGILARVLGHDDGYLIKITNLTLKKEIFSELFININIDTSIKFEKSTHKLFFISEECLKYISLDENNTNNLYCNVVSYHLDTQFKKLIILYKNGLIELRDSTTLMILFSQKILKYEKHLDRNLSNPKIIYNENDNKIYCIQNNYFIEIDTKKNIVNVIEIELKTPYWVDYCHKNQFIGIIGTNLKGIFFYDVSNKSFIKVKGLDHDSVGYTRLLLHNDAKHFFLTSWIGFVSIKSIESGQNIFSEKLHFARVGDLILCNTKYYSCGDDGRVLEHSLI